MLLSQVDPKIYEKYIVYEKSIPVYYMRLKKSLYGTLEAGLLFCKDLSGTFKYWGF